MTAFVVFWIAFMTLLFFLLGILFKGLAAAFDALLISFGRIMKIAWRFLAVDVGLLALIAAMAGYLELGVIGIFVFLLGFAAIIGVLYLLVTRAGIVILEVILIIADVLLTAIPFVLENMASVCERAYGFFLRSLMNRLDRGARI